MQKRWQGTMQSSAKENQNGTCQKSKQEKEKPTPKRLQKGRQELHKNICRKVASSKARKYATKRVVNQQAGKQEGCKGVRENVCEFNSRKQAKCTKTKNMQEQYQGTKPGSVLEKDSRCTQESTLQLFQRLRHLSMHGNSQSTGQDCI